MSQNFDESANINSTCSVPGNAGVGPRERERERERETAAGTGHGASGASRSVEREPAVIRTLPPEIQP